jgi:DNA polymerase-3 subunit alpha
MASLISSVEDVDKINSYLLNCATLGIEKLPPDINKSEDTFTVEGNSIRFGLTAVKNVGRSFVQNICRERENGGEFKSFFDFLHRMCSRDINKRAVESLIKCGAFDCMNVHRSQLIAISELAIDSELEAKKRNITGQLTLFGDDSGMETNEMEMPRLDEFEKAEILSFEKETMGIYFSGHPMEEHADRVRKITNVNLGDVMASVEKDAEGNFVEIIGGLKDGNNIKVCGIITSRKNKITKNNTQMAFLKLEDMYAGVEVIVFPKVLIAFNQVLTEENIVVMDARLSIREDEEPKLIMSSAVSLSALKDEEQKAPAADIKNRKTLYIRMGTYDDEVIKTTAKLLEEYKGEMPVCFFCADTKKKIMAPSRYWIREDDNIMKKLFSVFGEDNVKVN